MKRALAAAVIVVAALMMSPAAQAEPGKAQDGGWFDFTADCGGVEVDLVAHGGYWSAIYVPDGGHFLLTAQTITDLSTGAVVADLEHPGHTNQPGTLTCSFELDAGYFGFPARIDFEGFFQPGS